MFSSVVNGDAFVASFCTPDHYKNTFQNFLGGLTPCFCDVILLGTFLRLSGPVLPSMLLDQIVESRTLVPSSNG